MKPFSPAAESRPPWQNPARLRQLAAVVGILLLLYAVLFLTALVGGPRIGASFLPLPGGGPDPASPVAGLQPGQPTQNIPAIPPGGTTTSSTTPPPAAVTTVPTPLPTATTPSSASTPPLVVGSTPWPKPTTPVDPTTQIVEQLKPSPPVVTKTPPRPTRTTTTAPPPTTTKPTRRPTTPPPTTTTPTTPPTTPDNPPPPPGDTGLGGLVGSLLDVLGL
ncbi:hypothetical protein AB0L70_13590 [Kribbella sp. NPDC051952]|uniref:hypothetical protein n=1 Tax=Kribbella sp. NPDC051952 TaxID=3154851 RepID=UPI00344471DD